MESTPDAEVILEESYSLCGEGWQAWGAVFSRLNLLWLLGWQSWEWQGDLLYKDELMSDRITIQSLSIHSSYRTVALGCQPQADSGNVNVDIYQEKS